jgi:uncharacterized protein YsxB (DUF464 family)
LVLVSYDRATFLTVPVVCAGVSMVVVLVFAWLRW